VYPLSPEPEEACSNNLKPLWNGFAIATPEARPITAIIKAGRWDEDGGSYEGMNDRDIMQVQRNAGRQKGEVDSLGEQDTNVRCPVRQLMCSRVDMEISVYVY